MKRAMIIAGWVVLAAGPARAGLVGGLDPVTVATNLTLGPTTNRGMGILDAAGNLITSNVLLYPNASDIITVTFGIHWPYVTPVLVLANLSGLVWDTNEVVLLGAGPAGPFVTNNIGTTPAAGAAALNSVFSTLSGTKSVLGIQQFPISPFILRSSSTIPFFRVTFHAQSPFLNDGLRDLLAPPAATFGPPTASVGLVFRFFTTTMTTGPSGTVNTNINPTTAGPFINFGSARPAYGLELAPEPASASLLAVGVIAIASGAWQRRRRSHDRSGHHHGAGSPPLTGVGDG